jgi:hypothetical protein
MSCLSDLLHSTSLSLPHYLLSRVSHSFPCARKLYPLCFVPHVPRCLWQEGYIVCVPHVHRYLWARPGEWESLCPDVRPLILSKLSLRDLASAAPTCREFQRENRSRLAEEWARLIAVGEQTYGKTVFSAFVQAVRQLMASKDALPGLSPTGCNILYVNAAGDTALLTCAEVYHREYAQGDVRRGSIELYHCPSPRMFARLWREIPGGRRVAGIFQFCSTMGREGWI